MKTSHIPCIVALALAVISPAIAGGEGWTHDWEAAKKQAAAEKKDLLVDFSGSDWCGWCITLDKEVFQQEGFKNAAKDKFILVDIDFPRDSSKLSKETQEQNKKLGERFAIEGYPTVLLCDSSGKPYASAGYEEGGDQKYIAMLDGLRANKTKRDEGFAAAVKLQGKAKAEALVAALDAVPEEVIPGSYADVVEEIKKADPKDETGFQKAQNMAAKLKEYEHNLEAFSDKEDHKGALAYTDKTLKECGFEGEMKQQVVAARAMILAELKQFDEALKTLDAAKAIAPDSSTAADIEEDKEEIKDRMKEEGKAKTSAKDKPGVGDAAKSTAPADGKAAE